MKKFALVSLFLAAVLVLSACGAAGGSSAVPAEHGEKSDSGTQSTSGTADMKYDVKEVNIDHGDGTIYGRLYAPEDPSSALVILSHGFGGSYRDVEPYAKYFAENGITAYAFDFTGGGSGSRSGGSTTEMSVLTEADDLNTVIDYFLDGSDSSCKNIFLLGGSQGGFVSTYAAAARPDDIAGLIALFPAYVIQDDSRQRNPDPENGPNTSSLMGIRIGKIYDVDAQSFDIYDLMKNYSGKVLIIHGTADSIVPISYSERAAETFPNAELVKIDGAGHGFYGGAQEQAEELSVQFVKENEQGQDGESGMGASDFSSDGSSENQEKTSMTMTIGNTPVQVEWEDNESVNALKEMVKDSPLTIQMSMYGGFEQVGSLGASLPRDDVETTTSPGDIVLYSGDQIVVFYGSNSWAYSRLGKITDKTAAEMSDLLSNGNVTITITAE